MKQQTYHDEIVPESFNFIVIKKSLLHAVNRFEDEKHPIKRIKFKVTFYWK